MITNERQYKITRRKAQSFESAIKEIDSSVLESTDDSTKLLRLERDAMASVLADLREELAEYDRLKKAHIATISANSFEDLAIGLIKARIAQGFTQRELANQLGLKEQQIQRYEADRYASTSYKRLCEVANALRVQIKNEILLPMSLLAFDDVFKKTQKAGVSREFVISRLLSWPDAASVIGQVSDGQSECWLVSKLITVLNHVFGWTVEDILSDKPLDINISGLELAGFESPKKQVELPADSFAKYAHHLALVAINGTGNQRTEKIPTDSIAMSQMFLDRGTAPDDLRSVLQTVWDLGVIVFPLQGEGTFHWACWRIKGRTVIFLRQTSKFNRNWIFDLFCSLYYVAQRSNDDDYGLIQTKPLTKRRRKSKQEQAASRYAMDIMLNCDSGELLRRFTETANQGSEQLKAEVQILANEMGVSEHLLAYLVAHQLSLEDENWRGTEPNHHSQYNPCQVARDVFYDRFQFRISNEIDRSLLARALN